MSKPELLVVDRENAISETLDGEVVIIHLHSGAYYSADELGTELWNRFETGTAAETLARELAERFEAADGEIEEALDEFVATLRREGLIKPIEPDAASPAPLPPAPPAPAAGGKPPFRPPVFEVYEDLRDLLHADPIHDVMNAGWPHLKDDAG